eukprot:3320237-Prymnesium_polylepis.1
MARIRHALLYQHPPPLSDVFTRRTRSPHPALRRTVRRPRAPWRAAASRVPSSSWPPAQPRLDPLVSPCGSRCCRGLVAPTSGRWAAPPRPLSLAAAGSRAARHQGRAAQQSAH